MKQLLLSYILAQATLAGVLAQTYNYYDQYGMPQGHATWNGNGYSYYDQYGMPQGHSSWNGDGYNYYDQYGMPQGHSSGSPW